METESNVQAEVERIVNSDIAMANILCEGLFNINALSSKIVKEYIPDGNAVAVSTALRRYYDKYKSEKNKNANEIFRVLAQGEICTRDTVVKVLIEKSENTHSLLAAFSSKIKPINGHLFRLTEGIEHTLVIIDRKSLEMFERMIGSEKVIKKVSQLGQITLALPPETMFVPGVYSTLLRELSANGINIEEVHTCETNKLGAEVSLQTFRK